MPEPDLASELRGLQVAWPAEPDVAARVQAGLAMPRKRRGMRLRPALAWAVTLALVAFGVTLTVSPAARSAVLEFVGLRSVRVERREPAVSPGAGLRLGPRVTLDRARERAGFPVRVPAMLGAPDAVHLDPAGGRPRVALVYGARASQPRLLVQTLQAAATPLIEKSAGGETTLIRLTIDKAPAAFLEGAHGFAFVDGETATFEPQRLAGNTLLLERGSLLIRIEGAIPLAKAVAIARSLR